jgi:hypothetical protein
MRAPCSAAIMQGISTAIKPVRRRERSLVGEKHPLVRAAQSVPSWEW